MSLSTNLQGLRNTSRNKGPLHCSSPRTRNHSHYCYIEYSVRDNYLSSLRKDGSDSIPASSPCCLTTTVVSAQVSMLWSVSLDMCPSDWKIQREVIPPKFRSDCFIWDLGGNISTLDDYDDDDVFSREDSSLSEAAARLVCFLGVYKY